MTVWQNDDMTERIDALCRLTPKRRFEVLTLDHICREHDDTFSTASLTAGAVPDRSFRSFFLYYEGKRLVGELFVFVTGPSDAEITAIVDPYKRKNGIFTRLILEAQKELDKYAMGYCLVVEPDCADACDTARHMGLKRIRSELMMELPPVIAEQIVLSSKTDPDTGRDGIDIQYSGEKDGFELHLYIGENIHAGSVHISLTGDLAFVSRFEVDEAYRNRGYGLMLMKRVIETAVRDNPRVKIQLQVTGENLPALKLYEKIGFVTVSELDYLVTK